MSSPPTLRLRSRRFVTVTCHPTDSVVDETGGIGRLEYSFSHWFSFLGLLLQPQRRVTRTAAGIRLAVTWALIPRGDPGVKEQDHLYFAGDTRAYVVTAIKKYPRHLAYNLELRQ